MAQSTDFISNYYAALQNDPRPYTFHEIRAIRTIERGGPGCQLLATHLETNVRSMMGISQDAVVDWSSGSVQAGAKEAINWTALLAFIQGLLPIILQILPLFGL